MTILKNLIERCHERHNDPLRQTKTIITPAKLTDDYLYQYSVYCARRYPLTLDTLEKANISIMPIGRAPEYDHGPRYSGEARYLKRQGAQDWNVRRWETSWGIQIYTGTPSEKDGACWHDFDFNYEAICIVPDAVILCIDALINTTTEPLLTLTKSGGLRFTCRIVDYLHPHTEESRQFVYQHNHPNRDDYLKIVGDKGYSRWDARYEILSGDLLNPPVIKKEILFAPLDALRVALHEHVPNEIHQQQNTQKPPLSLGSHGLDLAKEAIHKRGYTYLRNEGDIYYWTLTNTEKSNIEVSLYEQDGTIWISASSDNNEIPMDPTPITNVWDDTGILPSAPYTKQLTDEKILNVRAGGLSPLSIRRPKPILTKTEPETSQQNTEIIHQAFERDSNIIGRIYLSETDKYDDIVSYLKAGGSVCINASSADVAETTEAYFEKHNVTSYARWKPRNHLWERAKEIPVDIRMQDPFQYGNVCEDPERCDALEERGVDPNDYICPQCPAYTACRERGYLSQLSSVKNAKAQILDLPQMFFDPKYAKYVNQLFETDDNTERLCIINRAMAHVHFPRYQLSIDTLRKWGYSWKGYALGDFAIAILQALEINKSRADTVKRIRAMIHAFEWKSEDLIQQMCQVNVPAKVVDRGIDDVDTGKQLARVSVVFDAGVTAYVPIDTDAADMLKAKALPYCQVKDVELNKDMYIQMSMPEAIQLGILDTSSVEKIQAFPRVYPDQNWTLWHQLKCFFEHYKQDINAPMRLLHDSLLFKLPPKSHPKVKKLYLMSQLSVAPLSNEHIRRAFPESTVEMIRPVSAHANLENQIYQIRTGLFPRSMMLSLNNSWDVYSISMIGQRMFQGICAEIKRDTHVKHVIFTYVAITGQLKRVLEKVDTCSLMHFRDIETKPDEVDDVISEADVVWIVGTPEVPLHAICRRAEVLFGNDTIPLNYEKHPKTDQYLDERVQSVYEVEVVGILTQLVQPAINGKVMLISGYRLPGITDSDDTLLFDWEDFEVAGSLDKLTEVIKTRQRYEIDKANLSAESSPDEVQHVMGCSFTHANRILYELRGGYVRKVTISEQIISLLREGDKEVSDMVEAIECHPTSVRNELKKMINKGNIAKVRRGLYTLM